MPLFPNYARYERTFVRGKGSWLYDQQGQPYLDLGSGVGVTGLGHAHPVVVQALQEQAQQLWQVSNLFQNPWQEQVATKLGEASGLEAAFFCNSGAEANEAAFKLIRKWAHEQKGCKHPEIITLPDSFHGRTLATLTATGQEKVKKGFSPLPEGFRIAAACSIEAIQEATTKETAAVCIELIQGEGGVKPLTRSLVQQLAAWCEEQGLLLMVDEIQTGMGRTGSLFAFEQYGIQPDLVTLAKGLGNGFPVGAMLADQKLIGILSPGSHGSTFGGNPLAMAVANAVLDVLQSDEFLSTSQANSQLWQQHLQKLAAQSPIVREVRGRGWMNGIEVTVESDSLLRALHAQGLIVLPAAGNVLRFLPPLILNANEMEYALERMTHAFQKAAERSVALS